MEFTNWKKGITGFTAAIIGLFLALFIHMPLTVSAAANTPEQVHVIVENNTFSKAAGASWEGNLIDTNIDATSGMNALDAVKKAVENAKGTLALEGNYITGINDLDQKEGGAQSGWMATVNDCFGNVGLDATPVKGGDEIRVMYSTAWGNDLRIRVIVENQTYPKSSGAPWDSECINSGVRDTTGLSAMDAVKKAVENAGKSLNLGANDSYITGIDGLNEMDGGSQSGWMAAVNDFFENRSLSETPVKAGDEIRVMYSTAWGNDLQVRVTFENQTYPQSAGAPWDNELVLISNGVKASDGLTAMDVVRRTLEHSNATLTLDEKASYIIGIQGLNAMDGGERSGWLFSLNGEFGSTGLTETPVKAGDQIRVLYSIDWGNDLGTTPQTIKNSLTGSKTAAVGGKLTQKVTGAQTDVTFTSSNPKVAAVHQTTGAITCKGVGKTVITSTAASSRVYLGASARFTLKVIPQKAAIKSVKSAKKGKITVKSDGTAKDYCSGYTIQYRQGKKGKIATIQVANKNKKALNKVIPKLKSGKMYQVRIRAYQKVSGQTYNGKYSGWKTVKKVK